MNVEAEQRTLLVRMTLLSYGGVAVFGRRGGEVERVGPSGELRPMAERWRVRFAVDTSADALDEARAELDAWIRRPLAPGTTETLEELCERIVVDGWAIGAEECARAMRCTPTLVRRARLAALRHPETGYALPERNGDAMAWARMLDVAGLTVRAIEALTGVPKSTLHDRLR